MKSKLHRYCKTEVLKTLKDEIKRLEEEHPEYSVAQFVNHLIVNFEVGGYSDNAKGKDALASLVRTVRKEMRLENVTVESIQQMTEPDELSWWEKAKGFFNSIGVTLK